MRTARIGAGYAATVAALERFLAGRELDAIRAERLPPELAHLSLELDEERRTARAGLLGIVRCTARVRPGLGATREAGRRADLPEALPDLVPPPPPDLPWPEGGAPGLAPLVPGRRTALERAVDAAFVEPGSGLTRGTQAVVVVHAGRIVAERYAPGIGPATPLLGWSMTKTLTAVLVGRLVLQGALDPTAPAPVPLWSRPGDPRAAITLEDLLRMRSGLEFRTGYSDEGSDSLRMLFLAPDCAEYAAKKPLAHPPGTVWSYSDGTSNVLAGIVRRSAGTTLLEQLTFPQRALFAPLGMDTAVISVDGSGTFVGSSLACASARDWARLGLLLAEDGVWRGERLLPAGWVDWMARPTPGSDGTYGAHVWLFAATPELSGVLYASGYGGQVLFVDRARAVVGLRLGVEPRPPGFDEAGFAASILRALTD